MWSVGCILLELLTGKVPWDGARAASVMRKVCDKEQHPDVPLSVPSELGQIVRTCFQYQPVLRPTIIELAEMLDPSQGLPNPAQSPPAQPTLSLTSSQHCHSHPASVCQPSQNMRCPALSAAAQHCHMQQHFHSQPSTVICSPALSPTAQHCQLQQHFHSQPSTVTTVSCSQPVTTSQRCDSQSTSTGPLIATRTCHPQSP